MPTFEEFFPNFPSHASGQSNTWSSPDQSQESTPTANSDQTQITYPASDALRAATPTPANSDVSQGLNRLPAATHDRVTDRPTDPTNTVAAKTAKTARAKLPEKARMACSSCNTYFRPPKTKNTTLCPKCRKLPQNVPISLPNTAPAASTNDQTIPLPDEMVAAAMGKVWDFNIKSADDAKDQLGNKPTYSVRADADDFDAVDNISIDQLSKSLFSALLSAPKQPPTSVKDPEKYGRSQVDAYKKCLEQLETAEDVGDASARCRLVIEEALKLHKNGISVSELSKNFLQSLQNHQQGAMKNNRQPGRPLTRTNLYMDVGVTCGQRIELMIDAVSRNKLVALDLLHGGKVSDLVRCPTTFLERKTTNFNGNRQKHDLEKEGGDARRKRDASVAPGTTMPATNGRKRKVGGGEDGNGDAVLGGVKRVRRNEAEFEQADNGYGTPSQPTEANQPTGFDYQGTTTMVYPVVGAHQGDSASSQLRLAALTPTPQQNEWDDYFNSAGAAPGTNQFLLANNPNHWAVGTPQNYGNFDPNQHSQSDLMFSTMPIDPIFREQQAMNDLAYPEGPTGSSCFQIHGYDGSSRSNGGRMSSWMTKGSNTEIDRS